MRRALILFGNELERENLIKSGKFLKEKLGFDLLPLYVRDITKEKLMLNGDGLSMPNRTNALLQSWHEVEKTEVENIVELLKKYDINDELIQDGGIIADVITEYMKKCDILLMGKNNILTENEIDILKGNYKSVILIGEKPLVSMENIIIGNDDGVKVNRSCYQFTNLFPEVNNFTSLVINKKTVEETLIEYLRFKGKIVMTSEINTSKYDDVINEVDRSDLFIMGNLSRGYFVEKIIGKNGVKLLEKVKTPIFIG